MRGWQTLIGFLAVVAMAAFVAYLQFDRMDPEIAHCSRLLPSNSNVGFTFKTDSTGKSVDIGFGAGRQTLDAKMPEQLEAFLVCVQGKGFSVKIGPDFARIPKAEVLGKVASDWNDDGGKFHLTLVTRDERLQNMLFPSQAGYKHEIVSAMCQTNACLECEPKSVSLEMTEARIGMRKSALVEKVPLSGGWPPNSGTVGPSDNKFQPWELVDGTGQRWAYKCTGIKE